MPRKHWIVHLILHSCITLILPRPVQIGKYLILILIMWKENIKEHVWWKQIRVFFIPFSIWECTRDLPNMELLKWINKKEKWMTLRRWQKNIEQGNLQSLVIIIFLYAIAIKSKATLHGLFRLPLLKVSLKMYFTYLKVSHYKSKQIKLFFANEVSSGKLFIPSSQASPFYHIHISEAVLGACSQTLSHVLYALFVFVW